MSRILRQLPQIIRSGQRAAYCSVVKTVGSHAAKGGRQTTHPADLSKRRHARRRLRRSGSAKTSGAAHANGTA